MHVGVDAGQALDAASTHPETDDAGNVPDGALHIVAHERRTTVPGARILRPLAAGTHLTRPERERPRSERFAALFPFDVRQAELQLDRAQHIRSEIVLDW